MPENPQIVTEQAPIGSTVCPSCRGWKWTDHHRTAFRFAFFVTFPLSILALAFVRPHHRCENCRYELNHTVGRPQGVQERSDDAAGVLIRLGCVWVITIGVVIVVEALRKNGML